MRGGILDVWPPGREAPVRLEFFGDTVDSLREFDPENQLSTRQLQVVQVPPMHELAVTPVDFQLWSEAARERWSDQRCAFVARSHGFRRRKRGVCGLGMADADRDEHHVERLRTSRRRGIRR